MTRNEDFLFAQEAIAQGFVSETQVEEALLLQRRMAEDLKLDERLGVILVKRGYLAEDQARRVDESRRQACRTPPPGAARAGMAGADGLRPALVEFQAVLEADPLLALGGLL